VNGSGGTRAVRRDTRVAGQVGQVGRAVRVGRRDTGGTRGLGVGVGRVNGGTRG